MDKTSFLSNSYCLPVTAERKMLLKNIFSSRCTDITEFEEIFKWRPRWLFSTVDLPSIISFLVYDNTPMCLTRYFSSLCYRNIVSTKL